MRPNGPQALAMPATVVVTVLWLIVACSAGGTTGARTEPPVPVAATAGTSAAVATPDAVATGSALTSGAPATLDPSQPPQAGLAVGDMSSVRGLLGTYCWRGACLDADPFTDREPDLPAVTLESGAEELTFVLLGTEFVDWSASYVDDDGNIKQLGGSQSSFDPDAVGPSPVLMTEATFPAPPAGSQSIVQVFVRFAEGGDASYGWNVTVP